MLQWLIVGGGIHGTYLANLLVSRFSVPLDRLAIVDPHDSPCMRWKDLTCKTGMNYLRSPLVHHVDYDPDSLREFLELHNSQEWAQTQGEFERPHLRLFNEHINHVVEKAKLYEAYRVARVTAIKERKGYLRVETTCGAMNTRKVLLAISPSEETRFPEWARKLKEKGASVRHVFDHDFFLQSMVPGFSYAVIGGGLSALQLALAAAKVSPGRTHLLAKGRIPIHKFDSDPCWLGPKCLKPFGEEKDLDVRREMINKGMLDGSAPREVATDIIYASTIDESLSVYHDTAVSGKLLKNGKIQLTRASGAKMEVDRVILATGFDKTCPGSTWLRPVIEEMNLPVHTCGYPIVDKYLRWHKRIFVTGALAELELGPAARRIFGARMTGLRLANYHKKVL